MKRLAIIFTLLVCALIGMVYFIYNESEISSTTTLQESMSSEPAVESPRSHPLQIEQMRKAEYPGSDIVVEETLSPGSNYQRYVISYLSDGYKIYALLTIPNSEKPKGGFPVILFNHGYIPPAEYRTTERYLAYTDAFSRNGYIVFRSDYRGHGNSEGNPEGAYYSTAYTTDVLNALASIKKHPDADPEKIGMWGHSMGGHITLRSMVVTDDIKVGVIWAGVVASYKDMAENWSRRNPFRPSQREQAFHRPTRQSMIDTYGEMDDNPEFWDSISPITFVSDVSGPIQIHHGTNDGDVPVLFSERLKDAMDQAGKENELYIYEGDDHNLSQNLTLALNRSVEYFDRYLK